MPSLGHNLVKMGATLGDLLYPEPGQCVLCGRILVPTQPGLSDLCRSCELRLGSMSQLCPLCKAPIPSYMTGVPGHLTHRCLSPPAEHLESVLFFGIDEGPLHRLLTAFRTGRFPHLNRTLSAILTRLLEPVHHRPTALGLLSVSEVGRTLARPIAVKLGCPLWHQPLHHGSWKVIKAYLDRRFGRDVARGLKKWVIIDDIYTGEDAVLQTARYLVRERNARVMAATIAVKKRI